jgi:PGF-CTERM protein
VVAVVLVVVVAPAAGFSSGAAATTAATGSSPAQAVEAPSLDAESADEWPSAAPASSVWSVRGALQEADDDQDGEDGQEGEDGEGDPPENETRNSSAAPGPDVGSAAVTVVREPEVVGLPLVVTATTTNEGTEPGRKMVQFEVEHEVLEWRNFTLEPGESRTVTFTHVFETPGSKTVEVDSGKNRFVTVAERRPSLAVAAVEVAPASVESGEEVTVTALVRNDGYANGSLSVALELFGEVAAVKEVTLATGESTEVTFTRTVYEPGSYEAVVENKSAAFRVVDDQSDGPTTSTDSVLESAAETPGFGAVAALAGALVAAVLALSLRRRT